VSVRKKFDSAPIIREILRNLRIVIGDGIIVGDPVERQLAAIPAKIPQGSDFAVVADVGSQPLGIHPWCLDVVCEPS
jgi:hypothetical protein